MTEPEPQPATEHDPQSATEPEPEREPAPEPEPLDPETAARLRRHGALLIALGIAGILWGVFHILGPVGDLQRRFPGQRVGYDMVKTEVHRVFFGGLVRSLIGLAVAMWGGKLRRLGGAGEE